MLCSGKAKHELPKKAVSFRCRDAGIHPLGYCKFSKEGTIGFKAFLEIVDISRDSRREEIDQCGGRCQVSGDVSEAETVAVAIRLKLSIRNVIRREELLVDLPAKHAESAEKRESDEVHSATNQDGYRMRNAKSFPDHTPHFFC